MKSFLTSAILVIALGLAAGPARAGDIEDVARQYKLPDPVVDTIFRNVDAFFAKPDGPLNRLSSGLVKEAGLKAVKSRMESLADSGPGKATESSLEERSALYKASVRTTRHEATEVAECVETVVTAAASEALPVIRDGDFTRDTDHPRLSQYSWRMTFCRTPRNGGSGYSDWQLKP